MAFASNNPFRNFTPTSPVAPPDVFAASSPMSSSYSAPHQSSTAPSGAHFFVASKNPFADVFALPSASSSGPVASRDLQHSSAVNHNQHPTIDAPPQTSGTLYGARRRSMFIRRTISDSSSSSVPVSEKLVDLSLDSYNSHPPSPALSQRAPGHTSATAVFPPPPSSHHYRPAPAPPAPPPPRSTGRRHEPQDLLGRFSSTDSSGTPRRASESSTLSTSTPQSTSGAGDPFATPSPSSTNVAALATLAESSAAGTTIDGARPTSRHRHASRERDRDRARTRDRDQRHREESRSHSRASPSKHHHHHHHSTSKHKHAKSSSPTNSRSKPNGALDKIDKLDVTGLFGTGFHHDGPFDACNPHRNVAKANAPMLAFPIDSENNALGPPRHMLAHVKGVTSAASQAIDGVGPHNTSIAFESTSRGDPVHGQATLGLGTSTFLEGAPASRNAIMQQKLKDNHHDQHSHDWNSVDFSRIGDGDSGAPLGRKKSIVQKLMGTGNSNGLTGSATSSFAAGESPRQPPPPRINTTKANALTRSNGTRNLAREQNNLAPGGMPGPGNLLASPSTPARMRRQVSSPAASGGGGVPVSPASPSNPPTSASSTGSGNGSIGNGGGTLLKRVRSLKVGGRTRH
ncbi:uncharacterized protein V1516DRAFT_694062 [Lipomyces oligophaga]|uniref:uncharacterized protein n=1 Tax=Lipomyces oligophaga TaxID=45792 RepID=UPI0034CF265A